MKPAPFRYHRPATLAQALVLLAEHRTDAKVLAGGQSLGPMMNLRLAQPAELVDLTAIPDLDYLRIDENAIEIGALATHHTLATSPLLRSHCPLLAEAAQSIGHYAIRARGTLGGSLAHADPAAQLPLVAATLGAQIVVAGPRGERRLAAARFFVSLMTTMLEPDEIIVAMRVPKAMPGERHAWLQFSRRRGDFAIVAVAVTLVLEKGRLKQLRLGVGGAEDKPVVLQEIAARSAGQIADAAWAAATARAAREAIKPIDNPQVPPVYRSELVEVLVRRALLKAVE